MKKSNYSVKECLRIAEKYGYSISVSRFYGSGVKYWIMLSCPFFSSPYPIRLTSVLFGQRMYNDLLFKDIIPG